MCGTPLWCLQVPTFHSPHGTLSCDLSPSLPPWDTTPLPATLPTCWPLVQISPSSVGLWWGHESPHALTCPGRIHSYLTAVHLCLTSLADSVTNSQQAPLHFIIIVHIQFIYIDIRHHLFLSACLIPLLPPLCTG